MSQHDLNIANATGPVVRQDVNNALVALVSMSSGATAPSPPFPNQLWYDTSTAWVRKRNNNNTSWVPFFQLDDSGNLVFSSIYPLSPPTIVNLTGARIDVTGIRADARRISIHVHQMTTSGSFPPMALYLSTSAGFHTAGYAGRRMEVAGFTAAEILQTPADFFEPINTWSSALSCEMTLSLRNAAAQRWSLHLVGLGGRFRHYWGHVDLPGVLTGFRWEPAGADTFTGGSLSYMVE